MKSFRRMIFRSKVGNANLTSNSRNKEPSRMKSLFRRSRSNDKWETWTDFHKKYQSDVYRKSANNQYNNFSKPMKKVSTDNENSLFSKMYRDSSHHQPKASGAQRRSSLGGPSSSGRRRASLAF